MGPRHNKTDTEWDCDTIKLIYQLDGIDDFVLKIIKSTPAKSCELDPIPTTLLYDNVDILLPTITNIINTSLITGIVPRGL